MLPATLETLAIYMNSTFGLDFVSVTPFEGVKCAAPCPACETCYVMGYD